MTDHFAQYTLETMCLGGGVSSLGVEGRHYGGEVGRHYGGVFGDDEI